MNPRVQVTLTLDNGRQVNRTIELSKSMFKDAAQPIDFPSDAANLTDFLMCTDATTRNRVLKDRRVLAEMIAAAITSAMLDHLGANDTEMGYTRQQREKMERGGTNPSPTTVKR